MSHLSHSMEFLVYLALAGLFVLWIILPLIPAVLLYRLFPNTTITVTGVFAGLKVNAAGAFGGYLVLFAAMAIPVKRSEEHVGSFLHPSWTIKGTLSIIDANKAVTHYPALFAAITSNMTPPGTTFNDPPFVIYVPTFDNAGLPAVTLRLSGYLPTPIPTDGPGVDRDEYSKIITIKKPVVIVKDTVNSTFDALPK